jgi:uncharacterized RDD family membrane protein YckC/Tfp pilus assembly major pilin PilA
MYCEKCGAQILASASFCGSCGATSAQEGDGSTAKTDAPAPVHAPSAPAASEPARYAGFWRRVAASVIDSLVQFALALIVVVAVVLVIGNTDLPEESKTADALYYLGSWLLGWLYFAWMHSSAWQATLGKRALGIKVVSLDGTRIGFGRATGRYFGYLLSGLIIGIGYLMAAFTKRKQALHDMMSSTLVVSRAATPQDIATGLAPPRVTGSVIALGIVAGMVPVAGIVAAITIPAYQDYVIRSQVAEGLTLASSQQAAIAEAWAQTGEFEGIDSESLPLPVSGSQYVKSVEVIDSVIEITFSDQANQHLVGRAILLVPGHTEQGDIVWTCGLAPIPDGVTPALRAHTQYTDVDPRFLPSACRR